MHPVIKENELTPECLKVWQDFKRCHAEKRVGRLFRACAQLENDLNDCLGREWEAKVEANKEGLDVYRRIEYLRDLKKEEEQKKRATDGLTLEEKIKLAKKEAQV